MERERRGRITYEEERKKGKRRGERAASARSDGSKRETVTHEEVVMGFQ